MSSVMFGLSSPADVGTAVQRMPLPHLFCLPDHPSLLLRLLRFPRLPPPPPSTTSPCRPVPFTPSVNRTWAAYTPPGLKNPGQGYGFECARMRVAWMPRRSRVEDRCVLRARASVR
eukprot:422849-Rhodomonas_salina.1